uniref:hypothetical protein n=1 Tax=Brachyspira pilosicoli TaxID=52584 RepID=UPI0012F4B213
YIIIILSIISFIILFICYNERSITIYDRELTKINNMYNMKYYDTNSIVSNHNEINRRILFLEERIAHYQNNSNNFASLWLALLSILFILFTGINLYNFNDKKKELEELIKEGNQFKDSSLDNKKEEEINFTDKGN